MRSNKTIVGVGLKVRLLMIHWIYYGKDASPIFLY